MSNVVERWEASWNGNTIALEKSNAGFLDEMIHASTLGILRKPKASLYFNKDLLDYKEWMSRLDGNVPRIQLKGIGTDSSGKSVHIEVEFADYRLLSATCEFRVNHVILQGHKVGD